MNGKGIAIIAVFCTAIVGMLLRPVMVAWARRIGGESADRGLAGEVAELRERLAELEGSAARLQELEERVDFTERIVAQHSEAVRIAANRSPT